jgi:hypothetical protein
MFGHALAVTAILVVLVVIWELAVPAQVKETFANYVTPVSIGSFYGQLVPARGDVGDHEEEAGWQQDPRYFHGYTDVQRLGVGKDYCRMVEPIGGEAADSFFACALAGTEGLSSTSYRTKAVKDGFRRSRDDYMRDIDGEGRSAYCSIIRHSGNTFQPRCYRARDSKFADTHVADPEPPAAIQQLLNFYDGILAWYRLRDDIMDYALNTFASISGGAAMDEGLALTGGPTKGLILNGVDQYLRLGESGDLALGPTVPMRFARAFSVWVRFDEFTNNARIFDFGNGAGKDNVFLGIVGRGNSSLAKAGKDQDASCPQSRVAPADEVRPQTLMLSTSANIDEYKCSGSGALPVRDTEPVVLADSCAADGTGETAHLQYEVWDGTQRVMRCVVLDAVKRNKWTHIAITTTTASAVRPDIAIYVDGVKRFNQADGYLPQASYMTHNYIGKSNWAADTDTYADADELLRGAIFDFRIYSKGMTEKKITNTIEWGRDMLGLKA